MIPFVISNLPNNGAENKETQKTIVREIPPIKGRFLGPSVMPPHLPFQMNPVVPTPRLIASGDIKLSQFGRNITLKTK